jgi:23S rRNA (uridine2552-2'-O)-methyltransferase
VTGSRRRGRSGGRGLSAGVKTAKGRKASSVRWLKRQLSDPYVAEARKRGYRSRAAFKLAQLDDRFHFLAPGKRIVDLGAAPGGWTQVAVERVRVPSPAAGGEGGKRGRVVAIDIEEMEPVPGATVLRHDFLAEDAPRLLREALGGPADVVLSDMSPPATGHAGTDHLRIMALCEAAFDFAREVLAPGGAFVAKVFQGGAERELLAVLRRDFAAVKHAKPAASRPDSAETYLVALGFRAGAG